MVSRLGNPAVKVQLMETYIEILKSTEILYRIKRNSLEIRYKGNMFIQKHQCFQGWNVRESLTSNAICHLKQLGSAIDEFEG